MIGTKEVNERNKQEIYKHIHTHSMGNMIIML